MAAVFSGGGGELYMAIQLELTENQEDLGSSLRLPAPPSGTSPLLLPVHRPPAPPPLPGRASSCLWAAPSTGSLSSASIQHTLSLAF